MWSDPDVTRFIGGRPFTREEVWARLLRYAGSWSMLGLGYWVVREKESQRFVGEVGFGNLHRDLTPPFGDQPEIGWVLSPWSHGHGYASEGVAAVLAWADARRAQGEDVWARTVCMIAPDNIPSIRVAAKAGYQEFARAMYNSHETILFERVAMTDELALPPGQ